MRSGLKIKATGERRFVVEPALTIDIWLELISSDCLVAFVPHDD
jgi:hypothetical protein